MKQQDWNHTILNHIDPELVESAAAPAKKRAVRPVRIAVIAACLCVALVGGAFAAEAIWGVPVFTPLEENSLSGGDFHGFTTVIEVPEGTDIEVPEKNEVPDSTTVNPLENQNINGVFKMPVDNYSQQARDVAAGLDGTRGGDLNFDSWDEAEEFLGIELMNNPVLEDAEPGSLFYGTSDAERADTETACHVTLFSMDGVLTAARTEGVYIVDRVKQYEGDILVGSVPVHVYVTVQSYTKHSPIAAHEMFLQLGFPKDYTFTPETYTTPGGLVANIVGVNCFDSTLGGVGTEYVAQFALNGNAVTLRCTFLPDSEYALSTLKQVLDSFK